MARASNIARRVCGANVLMVWAPMTSSYSPWVKLKAGEFGRLQNVIFSIPDIFDIDKQYHYIYIYTVYIQYICIYIYSINSFHTELRVYHYPESSKKYGRLQLHPIHRTIGLIGIQLKAASYGSSWFFFYFPTVAWFWNILGQHFEKPSDWKLSLLLFWNMFPLTAELRWHLD